MDDDETGKLLSHFFWGKVSSQEKVKSDEVFSLSLSFSSSLLTSGLKKIDMRLQWLFLV